MAARRTGSQALAGWLFADLLLVFALMMLGTQTGQADPKKPGPTVTTTSLATTTSTPAPTTTRPVGVEQQPHKLVVDTSARALVGASGSDADRIRASVLQQIQDQLRAQNIEGRRAAIVLSFGIAPTVGAGKPYAVAVNEAVRVGLPKVFGGAVIRDYWGAPKEHPTGFVELELYLFTS